MSMGAPDRSSELSAPSGVAADAYPSGVYAPGLLARDIRSRLVVGVNGLDIHILEAGEATNPCVLLLHGFPELAFSWRKIMLPLAAAGFHVVAPDQRGYGRTEGADTRFEADISPYRLFNLARDALGLVYALGHESVAAVVGHDFGSPVAACCAVLRPDVFQALALMSAPFPGMPQIALGGKPEAPKPAGVAGIDHAALAALTPPRKHYQWYYSQADANQNMLSCPQGVRAFLRAYYHVKSADWAHNHPRQLESWQAQELAKLPCYYVMDKAKGMAESVAEHHPHSNEVAKCHWLSDADLAIYAGEFTRTGFQGGLNWYRCVTGGAFVSEMQMFSGRKISVPTVYVAGAKDWGIYQKPGEFEAMQLHACRDLRAVEIINKAGHWVQQEQPASVVSAILRLLDK